MTEQVLVRAARDSDDLDALNAENISWLGAASTRSMFAAGRGTVPAEMFVAQRDGVPVGYAHAVAAGLRDGHRALALIFVPPAYRRTGVGNALWHVVREFCSPDRVTGIMISAGIEDEASQEVAIAHGWVRRGVHLESRLDLDDVNDIAALRNVARSISRPPGVVIRGLPAAATEADWQAVFTLYKELQPDTPDRASGADDLPYSVFRTFIGEPWQVLLAVAGERLIGVSAVDVLSPEPKTLHIWFTGVARDYRGHALSARLKATHAIALHKAGWHSIATANMDNNPAILAVNAKLGFVVTGGRVDLSYDHPTPKAHESVGR